MTALPPDLFDEKYRRAMGACGWVPLTNTQWRLVVAMWVRRDELVHAKDLDVELGHGRAWRGRELSPGAYGAVKVHVHNIRKRLGVGGPIELVSSRREGYGLRLSKLAAPVESAAE